MDPSPCIWAFPQGNVVLCTGQDSKSTSLWYSLILQPAYHFKARRAFYQVLQEISSIFKKPFPSYTFAPLTSIRNVMLQTAVSDGMDREVHFHQSCLWEVPLLAPGFKLMKELRKIGGDSLVVCSSPWKLFSFLPHFLPYPCQKSSFSVPTHLSTAWLWIPFSAIARPDFSTPFIYQTHLHGGCSAWTFLSSLLLLPVFFLYPHLSPSPYLPSSGLENEHKAMEPQVPCTHMKYTGIILYNLQIKMA